MDISPLQKVRYLYKPKQPLIFQKPITSIKAVKGSPTEAQDDKEEIKALFAHTYGLPLVTFEEQTEPITYAVNNVGVILSGGQAPGGHNVICGLYDAIKKANPKSKLIGFLRGPDGILKDQTLEMTDQIIDEYRNTGGFDIIGSGRTKLESEEQFDIVADVCKKHGITSLVII